MHEMSLCEAVVQRIEEQAQQRFNKVKTVWLEIGELAGVEIEAMRFSFDAVAKDTVVDGSNLEIINVPGRAICPNCNGDIQVSTRYEDCPECGHYPLDILAGEEMRIKELEVQ